MLYKIGMLCKHFKGTNLLEKNIYRIEQIGVNGTDIDESLITYTGDSILRSATNLIVYSNIFQDNKIFCREYDDISQELSDEQKEQFNQNLRVQPLTEEEQELIGQTNFVEEKKQYQKKKFN